MLDFMRDLRDESGAAVAFVHHVGHEGNRMRGSSDLGGYWESAITVKKRTDGQREIQAEHREAEAGPTTIYRADFDLEEERPPQRRWRQPASSVAAYLADHPDASANEVCKESGSTGRRCSSRPPR